MNEEARLELAQTIFLDWVKRFEPSAVAQMGPEETIKALKAAGAFACMATEAFAFAYEVNEKEHGRCP